MEIRKSAEEDEKGIRTLFAASFQREMSHEEWVWKYKESPWGSYTVIALDAGRIIAHYGCIRLKFHSGDGILDTFQTCDVMTHPKYRARVFSKKGPIVNAGEYFYVVNKMDFAFGFPSERHSRLQRLMLDLSPHVRVSAFRKEPLKKYKFILKPYRFEVGWDGITSYDIDRLWERCSRSYSLSIVKNGDYLLWRYKKHPVRSYVPLILRGIFGNKIKGLALVRFKDNEMNVLDFFVPETALIRHFWKALELFAIQRGARAVNTWVNTSEAVSRNLMDLSYTVNEGIPCAVKVVSPNITADDFYGKYCYRMGDYDDS